MYGFVSGLRRGPALLRPQQLGGSPLLLLKDIVILIGMPGPSLGRTVRSGFHGVARRYLFSTFWATKAACCCLTMLPLFFFGMLVSHAPARSAWKRRYTRLNRGRLGGCRMHAVLSGGGTGQPERCDKTSRTREANGSQSAMRFRGPCIPLFVAESWARIGAAWHGVCCKRSPAAEGMRGQAQFGFCGTALRRTRLQGQTLWAA